MIKPKKYKLRDFIDEQKYLANGFRIKQGYYVINKFLYRNVIKLTLMIDIEDGFMTENIVNEQGYPYAPFYNFEYGGENKIRDEVILNYNKFMGGLVHNGILKKA